MRYNALVLNSSNFFGRGIIYFQLILLLALVISFSASGVLRKIELYKNLPLMREAVVISRVSPSPILSPKLKAAPTGALGQKNEEEAPIEKKVLAESTSSMLCKGKKDAWTLVPNPDQEGLYTICNVAVEKMATVSELNNAQNDYRRSHGLNALNINQDLCRIANERAGEISKIFSHDGFEPAIKRSGLDKHSFGENIASGPLDAIHFIEWSWDRSPGHKANMLGDWTDGCAGVFDKYAVFLFAK